MGRPHFILRSMIILIIVSASMHASLASVPGIYKTASQYNAKSPSGDLQFTIDSVHRHIGLWALGKNYVTFSRLQVSSRQAHGLGHVFSFSDGQHDYVKVNRLRVFRVSRFAKAEPIGKYLYYHDVAYYLDRRLPFLWAAYPTDRLIDKETGKHMNLSIHLLKKLMVDKPELLQSFKNDKHKTNKLKEYLKAYYGG